MIGFTDSAGVVHEAPPHDDEAEAALIGCAVTDATFTFDRVRDVSIDDFYDEKHRILWSSILALRARGSGVDVTLLRGYLSDNHLTERIGGDAKIASLDVGTPVDAASYGRRVRDVSAKRALVLTGHRLVDIGRNGTPAADALDIAKDATDYLHRSYRGSTLAWGWVTSDALMAEQDEEVAFLAWPEVVARSHTTLFAAFAKAGKSFLAYGYFGAVSRGESWLGFPALGRPVKVAIVSEEGKSRIRARCRRFGVTGAVILPRGGAPLGTKWESLVLRSADRALEAGCEILCFDTMSSLAGLAGDDENSASAVIELFRPMLHVAETNGLAVVPIHHGNKAGGNGGRGIRGSSAFNQAPDEIVEMEVDGGDESHRRALRYSGRFDAPRGQQIVEYVEGTPYCTYRLLGARDDAKARDADLKVLGALTTEAGWLTTDEIHAEARPLRREAVLDRLIDLYKRHAIQRTGKGVRGKPYLFAGLGVTLESQPAQG